MLKERLLVILFLLPVGVLLIVFGGYPFDLFMTIILALSGWEYVQLFKKADGSQELTWLSGVRRSYPLPGHFCNSDMAGPLSAS